MFVFPAVRFALFEPAVAFGLLCGLFGFGAPVGVRPLPLFCFRVRVWFRASLTCSPRGVMFTLAQLTL